MPQEFINIGSFNDDPAAERIRESFDKSNKNFTELFSRAGNFERYSISKSYAQDAIVTHLGGVYRSLIPDNEGNVPTRINLTDLWIRKYSSSIVPRELVFDTPYNRGTVLYVNPPYGSVINTPSKLGLLILINRDGVIVSSSLESEFYDALNSVGGTIPGNWSQTGLAYQENVFLLSPELVAQPGNISDIILPTNVISTFSGNQIMLSSYSGVWMSNLQYPQNISNMNLKEIFVNPGDPTPTPNMIEIMNSELATITVYNNGGLYHNYPTFTRAFDISDNPNEPGEPIANYWELIAEVNGDSSGVVMNNIPVNLKAGFTLGKYRGKTTILVPPTGWTFEQLMRDIAMDYIEPVFSSFNIEGESSLVEVGTPLNGTKRFLWSITLNDGVVPTVTIRDITANLVLLPSTPNDGNHTAQIQSVVLSTEGQPQSWGITGNNTSGPSFTSTYTITPRFYRYFGPVTSFPTVPTNGASNRTYARNLTMQFQNPGTNTFTLMTGSVRTRFIVLLPPGKTILSVVDTNNSNSNLTADYVHSNLTIQDRGGVNREYNMYTLTIGSPYSPAREGNHLITTN